MLQTKIVLCEVGTTFYVIIIGHREVGVSCGALGEGESCAQGSSGETRGKEAIGETQT